MAVAAWRSEGKTAVLVASGGRCRGAIAVADTVRESAAPMIAELRRLGVGELVMVTGDHEAVGRTVGTALGIRFEAGLQPEDKLRIVEGLRGPNGGAVAMVGDGINDAPALTAADVGISLARAGTAVTLESADVVLMSDDLRALPRAVLLGRACRLLVRQNLGIAFGVMAALVLAGLTTHLRLPLAVAGHEGSTVLVVLNGLRMLRVPLDDTVLKGPVT